MRPNDLLLRCYAERLPDGQWQAFCLDLTLAAQADSWPEVSQKLNAMIFDYVHDALVGKDKDFAHMLLTRRAPLKYWLKFYSFVLLSKFGALHEGVQRLFCPPISLEPRVHNHA